MRPEIPLTLTIIRRKKNLTQIELADIVGLTQSEISSFENGRRLPNESTLKLIARALNHPVEGLLNEWGK
jgi:transcriptional regulator with XRE-family HTH domain